MKRSLLLLLLLAGSIVSAPAQNGSPDIHALVAQVNAGSADAVREQLPALLSEHPNDPGVLYLQALLTREGADAVRTYQSIVDNFPKDEWADDALFKVYQFYYALGLYRTAELKMTQLKTDYPTSPLLTGDARVTTPAPVTVAPEETKPGIPPPEDQIRPVVPKTEPMVQDPAPVSIPAAAPPTATARADSVIRVRFSLQVGAFTLHANAAAEKSRFEALGYDAEMLSKVRDTKSLFIVMIGNYATYDEAKVAAAELKRKAGVNAMVVSR
jgi:cell division septation protein DedD